MKHSNSNRLDLGYLRPSEDAESGMEICAVKDNECYTYPLDFAALSLLACKVADGMRNYIDRQRKDITEVRYISHGEPIPQGFERHDGLDGTIHGYNASLAVKRMGRK